MANFAEATSCWKLKELACCSKSGRVSRRFFFPVLTHSHSTVHGAMAGEVDSYEDVKRIILSAHKNTTIGDKVTFYNSWAKSYEQHVTVLEYRAPRMAADCIVTHFKGARESAAVLDVACGTGLVAKEMSKHGFEHFVGVDGSDAMLQVAKKSGLYQDLQKCLLGEEQLPSRWAGSFDVVVIVGALSVGQVPVAVIRDLCKASKPGGFICMTTRSNRDNLDYKKTLDREMKLMEEEGQWSPVEITEVEDWERAVSEEEDGYISGTVYLFRKL